MLGHLRTQLVNAVIQTLQRPSERRSDSVLMSLSCDSASDHARAFVQSSRYDMCLRSLDNS